MHVGAQISQFYFMIKSLKDIIYGSINKNLIYLSILKLTLNWQSSFGKKSDDYKKKKMIEYLN